MGLLAVTLIAVRTNTFYTPVRGLIVATTVFGLFTLSVLLRNLIRFRRTMIILVFFITVGIAVFTLGGQEPDAEGMRKAYASQLNRFSGTPYFWGGETRWGIDCSGLARTALWKAMVSEGIRERNPRLFGPMLWRFWWRDIGARAMGEETYGYTRVIGHADKLAGYDTSELKPGDLAVVGGTHVLIYVGGGKWIEASPEDRRVVTNSAPVHSKRAWFNAHNVTLVRWWLLE